MAATIRQLVSAAREYVTLNRVYYDRERYRVAEEQLIPNVLGYRDLRLNSLTFWCIDGHPFNHLWISRISVDVLNCCVRSPRF